MDGAVELTIEPKVRDIGNFSVYRLLPVAQRRSVGPFVFLDRMGPHVFQAGEGMDVRPHPHIGLATVTYLFDGEILHRDSLGSVQAIRPGDVNWMTAGSGIAHSERTPPEQRKGGAGAFGIQSWVALPKAHEETAPAFFHHGKEALPEGEQGGGVRIRVVAGSAFGLTSPVATFAPTLYCDVTMPAGARLAVPTEHAERAVLPVAGKIAIEGHAVPADALLVLRAGMAATIEALEPARLMLLGGEPLDGPRYMWWNFVSSSKDRIEQAKADWQAERFAAVPGETEFIPLPE
ncbi:MAG TPA: pirin family protein [Dongiaceae bacterium]|jgi:redox-sensitive bicupin YhaK (pirin superfamily)|nr:pirin family protein [Dongiaceae bacterium]